MDVTSRARKTLSEIMPDVFHKYITQKMAGDMVVEIVKLIDHQSAILDKIYIEAHMEPPA